MITGLNVVAEPGETVAIVGPTGAGKTTLVNLIMRFYELDSGRITSTAATSPASRATNSAPTSAWCSRTPGCSAARSATTCGTATRMPPTAGPRGRSGHLCGPVRAALPDGYDTIINDEGDNISTGEKQLMTIARAFLSDPAILILDEATSSVDTRTEVLIQKAMNVLRANRTSFVIAHRLSTIRGADVILVMEDGQIVEQGDHDSLLEERGAYFRLYNAQFAGNA